MPKEYTLDFATQEMYSLLERGSVHVVRARIQTAFQEAVKSADWSARITVEESIVQGIAKPSSLVLFHLEGQSPMLSVVRGIDRKINAIMLPHGAWLPCNTDVQVANINWRQFLTP